jgi:hypothetical protein
VKKDLDLFLPQEFGLALREKIARPFVFGPVEMTGLHLAESEAPFRPEEVRASVQETLEKTPYMPENVCIHGFKVTIKKRTLKRRSTIVKHSRFLRNLEVYPIFPPEPEPIIPEEGEDNQAEGEEDEND